MAPSISQSDGLDSTVQSLDTHQLPVRNPRTFSKICKRVNLPHLPLIRSRCGLPAVWKADCAFVFVSERGNASRGFIIQAPLIWGCRCALVWRWKKTIPASWRKTAAHFDPNRESALQQLGELSTGVLRSIESPWLWLQTCSGVDERSHGTLWDASICWSSSSADFTATQLEQKLRDGSVASIPQVKTAWSNYTVGHRV